MEKCNNCVTLGKERQQSMPIKILRRPTERHKATARGLVMYVRVGQRGSREDNVGQDVSRAGQCWVLGQV